MLACACVARAAKELQLPVRYGLGLPCCAARRWLPAVCVCVVLWYGPTVCTQHKGTLPSLSFLGVCCSVQFCGWSDALCSGQVSSFFPFLLLFQAAATVFVFCTGEGAGVSSVRLFCPVSQNPNFCLSQRVAATGQHCCCLWQGTVCLSAPADSLPRQRVYIARTDSLLLCCCCLRWPACAPLLLSDCAKCSQPANRHV
jgi:hypothetical protein